MFPLGLKLAVVSAQRFSIRHRAFVLGAVNECVAFLDAAVNEFFEDVADSYNSTAPPISVLPEDLVPVIRKRWLDRQAFAADREDPQDRAGAVAGFERSLTTETRRHGEEKGVMQALTPCLCVSVV